MMKVGSASNLPITPGRPLATEAPINTKLPVTCAVNKPNKATKPTVSTKPAIKALSVGIAGNLRLAVVALILMCPVPLHR